MNSFKLVVFTWFFLCQMVISEDVACDNGEMIDIEWLCDGTVDCDDESDEQRCTTTTPYVPTTYAMPDDCSCGCTPITPYGDIPGIIGGTVAKPYSWPWQIWINVDSGDGKVNTCGGSLIADKWIVTAAHCVKPDHPASDYKVYVSMYEKWSPYAQVFHVSNAHRHPKYDDVGGFDIGLIELSSPVTIGKKVQLVCLAKDDKSVVTEGTKMVVTGWGGTIVDTRESSVKLKQVSLAVLGSVHGNCTTDNEICTSGPHKGKAAYFGDSGGPLVRPSSTGNWYQYGVVSGFFQWSDGRELAKFVRLSVHCDWIKETTKLEICK